jgi:hypothetical protein
MQQKKFSVKLLSLTLALTFVLSSILTIGVSAKDTNKLGLVRSDESGAKIAVFNLVADLSESKVNFVEATITYDPAKYDVTALSTFAGDAVKVIKNDTAAGKIQIAVGVTGSATIGRSAKQTIAQITLEPKAGLTPDKAYVALSAITAYAAGKAVSVTASPKDASSAFSYKNILDVNDDGEVTAADLSLALYHFGEKYDAADFDKNGIVDILDITTLVNALYA